MSLQKRIIQIISDNPTFSATQVAECAGCRPEYVRVCTHRTEVSRAKRSIWTPEEVAQLYDLRDNKEMGWPEISEIMGKTVPALHSKYSYTQSVMLRHRVSTVDIVPTEREHDRRYRQSLEPRDLTAGFFGDPLPGYSALERRP